MTEVKIEFSTYTQTEKGFVCEDDYVNVPITQAYEKVKELENEGHMHITVHW